MTFDEFDSLIRKAALSRWAILIALLIGWGPLLVIAAVSPVLARFRDHDEIAGAGFASFLVLGPVCSVFAIIIAVKRWMR